VFYFKKRRQKLQAVAPFKELQDDRWRKQPSAHRRTERENGSLAGDVIITPLLLAVWLTLTSELGRRDPLFSSLTAFCAAAYRRLRPLAQTRACYQLGFQGERYVAEELNQLMADGFHVFHDVPFENYNMDHVLVGPTGVFVVETRQRGSRCALAQSNTRCNSMARSWISQRRIPMLWTK